MPASEHQFPNQHAAYFSSASSESCDRSTTSVSGTHNGMASATSVASAIAETWDSPRCVLCVDDEFGRAPRPSPPRIRRPSSGRLDELQILACCVLGHLLSVARNRRPPAVRRTSWTRRPFAQLRPQVPSAERGHHHEDPLPIS